MLDSLFAHFGRKVTYAPAALMMAVLIVTVVATVSVNLAIVTALVLTVWMVMVAVYAVSVARKIEA